MNMQRLIIKFSISAVTILSISSYGLSAQADDKPFYECGYQDGAFTSVFSSTSVSNNRGVRIGTLSGSSNVPLRGAGRSNASLQEAMELAALDCFKNSGVYESAPQYIKQPVLNACRDPKNIICDYIKQLDFDFTGVWGMGTGTGTVTFTIGVNKEPVSITYQYSNGRVFTDSLFPVRGRSGVFDQYSGQSGARQGYWLVNSETPHKLIRKSSNGLSDEVLSRY